MTELRKVERLTLRTAARTRDERVFPGSWLYPATQRIDRLPPCLVPETVYVISTRRHPTLEELEPFLMQMLTTAPDGLRYGWETCGGCGEFITRCSCRLGLTPPKYMLRWFQPVQVATTEPSQAPIDPSVWSERRTAPTMIDYGPHPTGLGPIVKLKKKLA